MGIDVFICYDERDEGHAEQLQEALAERGISSFSYEHDLIPGDLWDVVIPARLKEARVMALLVSEHWPVLGDGENAPWYPADEVAQAIQWAKPGTHHGPVIVPITLPSGGKERVPHGLTRVRPCKMRGDDFARVADALAKALKKTPARNAALLDEVVLATVDLQEPTAAG